MKKVIFVFLGIIILFFLINRLEKYEENHIDNHRSYEEIILLDSIKVKDKYVYWISYDLGVGGFSIGKLAYAKNLRSINNHNTFFISSTMTGYKYLDDKNELIIETYDNHEYPNSDNRLLENKKIDFNVSVEKNGNPLNSFH